MIWRPFGRVVGLQSRVARALAVRQAAYLERPLWLGRLMTLPVLITVFSASDRRWAALACALPALLLMAGRAARRRPAATGSADEDPYAVDRPLLPVTPRQRRIRGWTAAGDILAAQLLVFASAWLIRDLPAGLQYGTLFAAEVLVVVIALRVVLEPDWYRSGEPYPAVVDRLRAWCGVTCAAVSTGLALLGHLTVRSGALTDLAVVCAISSIPLVVTAFTIAQDHLILHVSSLIRQEAQDGRQAVLDETHGALSTTLRLLEQRTRDRRTEAPQLYELAVIANAGLRETLTLADPEQESPDDPDTLRSIVSTLALSVGASFAMKVDLRRLDPVDRDVARVVLNELVGLALTTGTTALEVSVGTGEGAVRVVVSCVGRNPDSGSDDQGPAGLDWLNCRLSAVAGRAGSVTADGRSVWSASWRSSPGTVPAEHHHTRRLVRGGATGVTGSGERNRPT